jgi:hypothetical protein
MSSLLNSNSEMGIPGGEHEEVLASNDTDEYVAKSDRLVFDPHETIKGKVGA